MENKPSVPSMSKKALALIGLMLIGVNTGDVQIVGNYQETYCHAYDPCGVCIDCPTRSILTEAHTCLKVSDQCKTWCNETALCTSCYQGWALYKGTCILPSQVLACYLRDIGIKSFDSQNISASTVTEQNLQTAFTQMDQDGNGKLTTQQINDRVGGNVSQQQYQQLLSTYDTDQDGSLSKNQFVSMMQSILKM